MKLSFSILALGLLACGGAATNTVPASTPSTTSATPAATPVQTAAPETTAADITPAPATPAPAPTPPVEAAPEKCDGGWVCVKVNLATGKVEKRDTKLMGDPKIESTWSKQSDGRTVTFDEFSKGAVELTLRRNANKKNDVVVKLAKGGPTVVIDKHDGGTDEFTHIGAIATEQDGALLIDMRYMR